MKNSQLETILNNKHLSLHVSYALLMTVVMPAAAIMARRPLLSSFV